MFAKILVILHATVVTAAILLVIRQERLTLAHEVQHALQDQHFGLPDLATFDDYDALLAYKALSEGDATVTAI